MTPKVILAACALSLSMAGTGQSAPLSYIEPSNEDFPINQPLALGLDENTVQGVLTACGSNTSCTVDNVDYFSLIVGPGLSVTSASIFFDFIWIEGGYQSNVTMGYFTNINGFAGTLNAIGDSATVPGPITDSSLFQTTIFSSNDRASSVGYKWTFTVEAIPPAVPLPAGLTLLAAGLGALGLLRRRKARD